MRTLAHLTTVQQIKQSINKEHSKTHAHTCMIYVVVVFHTQKHEKNRRITTVVRRAAVNATMWLGLEVIITKAMFVVLHSTFEM